MKADESADYAVRCVARQRTGLRNPRFIDFHGQKHFQNNSDLGWVSFNGPEYYESG
jgi:hypothetical protein